MSTKRARKAERAERPKAFAGHIAELQSRLLWVAAVFIGASAVAYSFRDILIDIILSPIGHQQLIYLTPGGGFIFIFKVMLYTGMLVAAPLMVYHVYRFVQPALPSRARRYSVRLLLASIALMIAGVLFGYFVAVPSALHFLMTFAEDFVSPNLTADSYLGFITAYVVGLGILFQLPLLLIIWNWISPLPPGGLWSTQRWVILFSFIAAAIITPTPDPANQTLVALPIILVYQIGVVAVYIANRKLRRATKKAAKERSGTGGGAGPDQAPKPALATAPLPSGAVASAATVASQATPRRVAQSIDGLRSRPRVASQAAASRRAPRLGTARQPSTLSSSMVSPSRVRAVGIDGFAINR